MLSDSRIPLARKQTIRLRLEAGQPVTSAELSLEFGVSEDAIRRDLRALAAEGACQKVYGGALPLSPASATFAHRVEDDGAEKALLSRTALALLKHGQTIFLDASSTNLALARLLSDAPKLRVITNSFPIATELMGQTGVEACMVGGELSAETAGCIGDAAIEALQLYNIDLAILGACSFALPEGLSGFHPGDVQFKKALIRASRQTAVMLTKAKINTTSPYRICPTAKVGTYVITSDAPVDLAGSLRQCGCLVHVAFAPQNQHRNK